MPILPIRNRGRVFYDVTLPLDQVRDLVPSLRTALRDGAAGFSVPPSASQEWPTGLTSCHGFGQNVAATDAVPCRYVNSELPNWLRLGGEERVRFEDIDGIGYQNADNSYLLQRLRLNLDATPLPWLKLSFQAQDSLVFFTNVSPAPSSQKDSLDLRVGYVQVGDSEAGPISVRAGRQGLNFGEGRLVADPNWSNVGRTFDGVPLILRYKKVRLDAFTGASDQLYTNGFATPFPGEHFDGLWQQSRPGESDLQFEVAVSYATSNFRCRTPGR
jgi:hypothetical protein